MAMLLIMMAVTERVLWRRALRRYKVEQVCARNECRDPVAVRKQRRVVVAYCLSLILLMIFTGIGSIYAGIVVGTVMRSVMHGVVGQLLYEKLLLATVVAGMLMGCAIQRDEYREAFGLWLLCFGLLAWCNVFPTIIDMNWPLTINMCAIAMAVSGWLVLRRWQRAGVRPTAMARAGVGK